MRKQLQSFICIHFNPKQYGSSYHGTDSTFEEYMANLEEIIFISLAKSRRICMEIHQVYKSNVIDY